MTNQNTKKSKRVMKRILLIVAILLALLIIVLGAYVAYLSVDYERIPDQKSDEIVGTVDDTIKINKEYTALTYNIGFGAYNQDFSFFMDKGIMDDGREVVGEYSRARSKEITEEDTYGVIDILNEYSPDFALLQEVDVKADRSHDVNQYKSIIESFKQGETESVYTSNFHTPFLAYPFKEPIGRIESGLLTISDNNIAASMRRSFPVDDGFITKFFDLDRCFSVNRLMSESGHELVLINTHMSAYDEGGKIREQQMEMLTEVLDEEYAKGNWVIVGGDFNHALFGTTESFESEQQIPEWVQEFDEDMIPDGFNMVKPDNYNKVATVRGSDLPYTKGINYRTVIDGFLVSDNVQAETENIDADFMYSDHNPVLLKFILK